MVYVDFGAGHNSLTLLFRRLQYLHFLQVQALTLGSLSGFFIGQGAFTFQGLTVIALIDIDKSLMALGCLYPLMSLLDLSNRS